MLARLFVGFLFSVIPVLCFCHADCKAQIEELQNKLTSVEDFQKKDFKMELALAFLEDQDLKQAIETFLTLLTETNSITSAEASEEEIKFYQRALKTYSTNQGPESVVENAQLLKTELEPLLAQHPDYYQLNFILSAAYANLGDYTKFMQSFYRSYDRLPDHYLAFKGKAALHIKLFERSSTEQERTFHKEKIIENVIKAIERNSEDVGLYKWIVLFAPEKERNEIAACYLNKMIEKQVVIQRADVAFFIQKAAEIKRLDLGQQVLDKAKENYQYSRVVLAAQEFLDKEKKRNLNE